MKAFHVKVYGRVQGVWFRASIQEEAISEDITGWVKNTFDGAVEIFMQGKNDAVERLLRWCHHGPPGARVDRVDIEDAEFVEGIAGFRISY